MTDTDNTAAPAEPRKRQRAAAKVRVAYADLYRQAGQKIFAARALLEEAATAEPLELCRALVRVALRQLNEE